MRKGEKKERGLTGAKEIIDWRRKTNFDITVEKTIKV